jgi:hypothetical protein
MKYILVLSIPIQAALVAQTSGTGAGSIGGRLLMAKR